MSDCNMRILLFAAGWLVGSLLFRWLVSRGAR